MSYPPDYKTAKKLFGRLQQLDAKFPGEYKPQKYELIHDIAEARFFEAKDYFILGLENPDGDYRLACVSALTTHWQVSEDPIPDKLMNMAIHDPDIDVRKYSIDALGFLRISASAPILKMLVMEETEYYIKNSAYIAILWLLGGDSDEIVELSRDLNQVIVDPNVLKRIS